MVLDKELDGIGVSRGRGSEAKSAAKLVCPLGSKKAFDGWNTQYVRDTCMVLDINAANEYLGTRAGGQEPEDRFQEKGSSMAKAAKKVAEKRHKIAALQHTAAELTLLRRCADVAALT